LTRETKYASELKPRDYCYIPGQGPFSLDWDKLQLFDDSCFLVALDRRQIAVLLAHLATFPRFSHIWSLPRRAHWDAVMQLKWDDINRFLSDLEFCLMSGCDVSLLLKTNLMIAAAISGDTVDLDSDIEDLVQGLKDYSTIGLSPQFVADSGNNLADVTENLSDQQTLDLNAIKTSIDTLEIVLQDIKTAIETSQDLEDDLANVWNAVSGVVTILGGVVGAPPVPL
jgi:hypothetical protein